MSKKVLNIKRKLLDERNVTKPMPDDLILFQEIIDESKRNFNSQKRKEKSNSNSSGDLRIISVLKDKEVITLSTKKLSEFKDFIDLFNCLYYIKNGKRYYLINPKKIEEFFENSDFHYLYDLDFATQFNEKLFIQSHRIRDKKKIKTINEFCIFHKYYFRRNDHTYFYTALRSPNRVLKFNRCNEKNTRKYKNPDFEKCSNSRITRFYGPKGTGKTTLIYAFFKTISYVPEDVNSHDNINYDKKDSINLKNINLYKNHKINIKNYKNTLKDNIEVDSELSLIDSSEELISDSNEVNNNIDLEEKYKKENSYESKKSKENQKMKNIISPYYQKEYENNDSTEEEYNFLSSVYIDLEKEKTEELSKANQKYFEYELMQLFRTYKYYQYIISYINGNKKNNIFDKIKLVVDFMKEIKNKRNYFIIIDHISEDEQNKIMELEKYMLKAPYCYCIELPFIRTIKEKLNFFNDFRLNEGDELEKFKKNDEISFIKRNKTYGVVYSTNFYSPIFDNNNKDDVTFQENFGKNIYFYCLWKYSDKKMKIDEFIEKIGNELCQLFRDNYNNDENKLLFNIKTILYSIEEKKGITDKEFLTNLPLEYFVLINKDNIYFLDYSFPLIEKVLKKLNISSSVELIKSRLFISYFDNYIKGGIMKKVFAEKMEENYLEITKNNLITINIERIIDNNIRDYYDNDEENYILKKNKTFTKIKNENINLKNKNILFNQCQNANHYDLGIKLFKKGNNFGFFQVTFHKTNPELMELINNLWIDLNYGINKIINLCDENNEKIEGIYVFFVLMDLESYHFQKETKEEKKIKEKNKKDNENLIEKLKEYNIDYLFLDNNGNITKDGLIIKEIPFKLNLVENFKIKIKELNTQKKELEKKYLEDFKKIYPNNEIDIYYFNPINKKKLKTNMILVHLFKNINDNYFEINENDNINYYDMNKNHLAKYMVDGIENDNKKDLKMNILLKLKFIKS